MSAPTTSSLSVELLSRVIDVKYGCFTFTFLPLVQQSFILSVYFTFFQFLMARVCVGGPFWWAILNEFKFAVDCSL